MLLDNLYCSCVRISGDSGLRQQQVPRIRVDPPLIEGVVEPAPTALHHQAALGRAVPAGYSGDDVDDLQ